MVAIGMAPFERFSRQAANLDVDKAHLKRYESFALGEAFASWAPTSATRRRARGNARYGSLTCCLTNATPERREGETIGCDQPNDTAIHGLFERMRLSEAAAR